MDAHLLAIKFRFYMGIVWWLYETIFPSNRKTFQGKSLILKLYHTFFLFPKMLICPSDLFCGTNVMLLGQAVTLKCCFLLSFST